MKLIITQTIFEQEFKTLKPIFSLRVIKEAARKILQGLGENLKSSFKIHGTKLKKLPLTSTGGAGRVLFLLNINDKEVVLLMIRLKNDKKIGENMTVKNPQFKKLFNKYIQLVIEDIQEKKFMEYEL
jgi:hypothetical protein